MTEAEGGGGNAPAPSSPEHPTSTLFLAIAFPADGIPNSDVDPEQVADELVHILNQERFRNGCSPAERLWVAGIPAPQWLTRRTLDNLMKAAHGDG